tara:strand:- start:2085 stop:2525 length:441 start_codon:yes stop_codon:yes gene_type:complete
MKIIINGLYNDWKRGNLTFIGVLIAPFVYLKTIINAIFSKDIYEGNYKNGLYHGKGFLKNNFNQYTGDFINGRMHGKGIQQFENGIRYEGEFQNGLWHGYGIITYENGESHKGYFIENKIADGKAIYKSSDGIENEYEFKNGKIVN